MSYIGVPPFGRTVRTTTELTATAGQTNFMPAGGYIQGYVDVFLNGVSLAASDFTATDGTNIVLTSAAALNDEIKVIAYWPVSMVDTYRKGEVDALLDDKVSKAGDTISGNLQINVGGVSFTSVDVNGYPRFTQSSGSAQLGLFRSGSGSVGGGYVGGDGDNCLDVRDSAFTTRLRVSQSGVVIKPNQPAFQAYGVGSGTFASNSVHIYPSTRFNIGNHYNTSNGRFTAPVAGIYLFGWTQIGGSVNETWRYRIRKNGVNVGDVHLRLDTTATGGEYGTNGVYTFPINLAALEYVEIFFQSDSGNAQYPGANDNTNDYPLFWGYLLG